jgi:hypothetical protein
VAPSFNLPLAITPTLSVRRQVGARQVRPAAPDPTTRTVEGAAVQAAALASQAQEHIFKVGIARRHVDDSEPLFLQRVQHLAGVDLVLAVMISMVLGPVMSIFSKQEASGGPPMSRSTSTTTALSCALATSSRVGSLAISFRDG